MTCINRIHVLIYVCDVYMTRIKRNHAMIYTYVYVTRIRRIHALIQVCDVHDTYKAYTCTDIHECICDAYKAYTCTDIHA